MTDGLMVPPGGGSLISVGALQADVKISATDGSAFSLFEVRVPPGFDVGAHRHTDVHEMFYVLEGEIELLCFDPVDAAEPRWQDWVSADGDQVCRAGPGAALHVPPGCAHAFANATETTARMLFLTSPAGHEAYLRELGAHLAQNAVPDPDRIADIRREHGIEQLRAPVAAAMR